MHTKKYYFMKGWEYARVNTVQAWGACDSWQRKVFKMGYEASRIYLEGEALREGFDSVDAYQNYLIKQVLK